MERDVMMSVAESMEEATGYEPKDPDQGGGTSVLTRGARPSKRSE
jgi:hypothetical protein